MWGIEAPYPNITPSQLALGNNRKKASKYGLSSHVLFSLIFRVEILILTVLWSTYCLESQFRRVWSHVGRTASIMR